MKAYVLGVKARFRGENLVSQLKALGFDVEIVYGIDARDTDRAYLESQVDQKRAIAFYGHRLTPGEICCALGHREIQRRIVEAGVDWALVLEDDVAIRPDELRVILGNLPKVSRKSVITLRITAISDDSPATFGNHLEFATKLSQPPFGTWAYVIGLDAARLANAAESGSKILGPSDWPLQWRTKVGFYAANEPAVDLLDVESELEKDRVQAEKEFGWRKSGAKSVGWRIRAVYASVPLRNMRIPALRAYVLSPIAMRIKKKLSRGST